MDDLIRRNPPLDTNSRYLYLLLCHHHAETCVVAELEGRVVGCVTAYRPPRQPQTLFVWQVAVDESARGRGLASRMLDELLGRESCGDVRWLETTVTPDNRPSQRLFEKLAERYGAGHETSVLFEKELFGAGGHEDEVLHRIGPLQR